MKNKLIVTGLLAICCYLDSNSQNTSFDQDLVPISGVQNSAFGAGALNNTTSGTDNTASGFRALNSNSTGNNNTAKGSNALFSNTSGNDNSASGIQALYSNTTGNCNTAHGSNALFSNNTGNSNTGVGFVSLYSNTIGTFNAALGDSSLYHNTSGGWNVATGHGALLSNTTASANVANGFFALHENTTGSVNTAVGAYTLRLNTTGTGNTGIGGAALNRNTTGYWNTAVGLNALVLNLNGVSNTGIGSSSLYKNTSGNYNTSVGVSALGSNTLGSRNTAIGTGAAFATNTGSNNLAAGNAALNNNTLGSNNTACGYYSLQSNTTGTANSGLGNYADVSSGNLVNATSIGNGAIVNTSDKIRFGDANVTVVEGPVAYTISDGRFKTNVKEEEVKGLAFIKLLRPVVYNFDSKKFTEFLCKNMPDSVKKNHLEKDFNNSMTIRQSGFIAQEVEKAASEAGYNFNGVHHPLNENDNYSLAYGQFVVPLVKAVQEQQLIIERQKQEYDQKLEALNNVVEAQKELLSNLERKTTLSNNTEYSNLTSEGFVMGQNQPNPFTHETLISYTLPPQTNSAFIAVYDLTGKQLASFPLNEKGNSSITITSEKLAAGIYIYSIVADGKIIDSKRMVVAEK